MLSYESQYDCTRFTLFIQQKKEAQWRPRSKERGLHCEDLMNNIAAIFKKEFRSYFNSPIAYIFITFFLALSAWFFFRGFFLVGQAVMRGFFSWVPWIFLLFIPAVTMKLWAEEKKIGTVEILMTLPIKDYEVVLGKYLAGFCLLGVTILLSLSIPITVAYLGEPDGVPSSAATSGFPDGRSLPLHWECSPPPLRKIRLSPLFLGIVMCFGLLIIGEDIVLFNAPNWIVPIFSYLGLGAHFSSILRGVSIRGISSIIFPLSAFSSI